MIRDTGIRRPPPQHTEKQTHKKRQKQTKKEKKQTKNKNLTIQKLLKTQANHSLDWMR